MGFFKKITKEISRPFKQAGKEIERVVNKSIEESIRPVKQLADIFKPPEFDFSIPEPTIPPEVIGEEDDAIKKRVRRTRGRAGTIITGDLASPSVGRKTLLG